MDTSLVVGKCNAVFGHIQGYVCKIEFQGRGSVHAHIAIMLVDDPNSNTTRADSIANFGQRDHC